MATLLIPKFLNYGFFAFSFPMVRCSAFIQFSDGVQFVVLAIIAKPTAAEPKDEVCIPSALPLTAFIAAAQPKERRQQPNNRPSAALVVAAARLQNIVGCDKRFCAVVLQT